MEVSELEIFIEGEGLDEIRAIRLPVGSSCREAVAVVAAMGGFPVEEGLLFVEDGDEPLDLAAVLVVEEVGKVHHVHRARQIAVTVNYQALPKTRQFSPATRIQRVLDWAVGPDGFKLDPAVAPEMELALVGSQTALPKSAHLGRYVRHPDHRLALDLIRGVVPNGASDD